MKSMVLLLFLAIGSESFGRTKLHRDFEPEKQLGQSKEWKATRLLQDNQVSIEFTVPATGDQPEKKVSFKPLVSSSFLLDAEIQRYGGRDYLITVWQEGAHFTMLRILNPKAPNKIMVWEKGSIGDLRYELLPDGLQVRLFRIPPGKTEAVQVMQRWKAGR